MSTADDGVRRAWGWLAHLRSGGTTAWSDWRGGEGADADPAGAALPGAQQLEVLRRLNETGRPSPALVERVLQASAAGRGSPDLELAGSADESAFGPRPVDPAALPVGELLRVVTSLLAEELSRARLPEPPRHRRRPWRRGDRVVGDPLLAGPLTAELARRGRAPGPRSPVWVLGAPLAQMLGDVWVERCFGDGAPSWPSWVAGLEQRRQLPPRVDLPRVAADWARRSPRVTVLLDPASVVDALGRAPVTPPVSLDAAELARRLAPVLALMVPPERRARLLGEVLRPRLATHLPGGVGVARPGVPPDRVEWVARRARRMAEVLARGDYAVEGDPRAVLPAPVAGSAPSAPAALELGLRILLDGPADPASARPTAPDAREAEE